MSERCPATEQDLCDAIHAARASREKLEIVGGGSKHTVGASRSATLLDISAFRGVIDYDPAELVLTVRAATPLADVESLLDGQDQMLAFEPWDHGPLLGGACGRATIGGVIAAGVAGPRRLSAGGARDHILGFAAISGTGERFIAGGKVVKNVTGFDLSKLVAASWGQLAVLTELSLKVLPKPRTTLTLACEGLSAALARTLILDALANPFSVAAAAYLPAGTGPASRRAMVLLRLEGFPRSVRARADALVDRSSNVLGELPCEEAELLWNQVRVPTHVHGESLWRVHLPASAAASLLEEVEQLGGRCLLDWGGSLLWIGWDGDPFVIRPTVEAIGGHAMLMRAPAEIRNRISAHHPRLAGLAALEQRVRHAFDPEGVFDTGRFS